MSQRALELAVRDSIQTTLFSGVTNPQTICDVMDDGEPSPRCGDWFYAVHGESFNNGMQNTLDETYSVTVTVTGKIRQPFDRLGTDLVNKATTGLNDRVQALKYLHMNYTVMAAANATILAAATGDVYGFCEPLRLASGTLPARVVGASWFKADPTADLCGLVCDVRFVGARRIQPNTNIQ